MNRKTLIIAQLFLSILIVPLVSIPTNWQTQSKLAIAQADPDPAPADQAVVDPGKDLWGTVNDLINLIRPWVLAIAVLIIIYTGILYETSAMNLALQSTAKTILWTTISGLIFMVLYPTIVGILSDQNLIPTTTVEQATAETS